MYNVQSQLCQAMLVSLVSTLFHNSRFRFAPLFSNHLPHLLSAKNRTRQRGTSRTSCPHIHKTTCVYIHLSDITMDQVPLPIWDTYFYIFLVFHLFSLFFGLSLPTFPGTSLNGLFIYSVNFWVLSPDSTEILNKVMNNLFIQPSGPFSMNFCLNSWHYCLRPAVLMSLDLWNRTFLAFTLDLWLLYFIF